VTLADGRRKSFYGKTEKEARAKADAALDLVKRGVDLSVRDVTVRQFLAHWIETVASYRVRPSTLRSYQGHIDTHIVPAFGNVKLRNLGPQQVNQMLANLVAEGRSPTTANRVRATLRSALASAVKWGYVHQNVAGLADPKRERRQRVKPLELEQVHTLLDATRDHKYGPLFHLAIATGLRQGELFALRWDPDVDLDAGTITVRFTVSEDANGSRALAEPKTEQSRRTIRLPSSAVGALERQRALDEEYEITAAHRWQDNDLVFCTSIGTFLDPSTVTRALQAELKAAGLPRQRFHDLRHCTASLLLAEGLDLFAVKEILGHSQISLAANTYGHMQRKLSEDAATRLESALGRRAKAPD
jgi:integrase